MSQLLRMACKFAGGALILTCLLARRTRFRAEIAGTPVDIGPFVLERVMELPSTCTEGISLGQPVTNPACVWLARAELVERCLGNLELADRVLRRFRDGIDDTLTQLQVLAEADDLAALARRAHRLKGEAGNVGAERISLYAAEVEELAARGLSDPARVAVAELVAVARQFREQVLSLSDIRE